MCSLSLLCCAGLLPSKFSLLVPHGGFPRSVERRLYAPSVTNMQVYSFASFHVSQQCVLMRGVRCEGRRLVPGGKGCFAARRGRRGLPSAALLVALCPSCVSPVSVLEVRQLFGKCPVCSCSVGYAEVPKSARKQGWGFLDMMDNVCKLGRGKLFLWLFSLSGCFTGSVGDEHRTDDNKSTREKSLAW